MARATLPRATRFSHGALACRCTRLECRLLASTVAALALTCFAYFASVIYASTFVDQYTHCWNNAASAMESHLSSLVLRRLLGSGVVVQYDKGQRGSAELSSYSSGEISRLGAAAYICVFDGAISANTDRTLVIPQLSVTWWRNQAASASAQPGQPPPRLSSASHAVVTSSQPRWHGHGLFIPRITRAPVHLLSDAKGVLAALQVRGMFTWCRRCRAGRHYALPTVSAPLAVRCNCRSFCPRRPPRVRLFGRSRRDAAALPRARSLR